MLRIDDDAAALARAAQGDPAAFDGVVRRHEARVRSFLARVSGATAADDLAQQTFVAAWRKAGQYRGDGPVGAWLLGIAWTVFLMERRAAGRELRRRTAFAAEPTCGHFASPDAAIDVRTLLAALNERERAALVLTFGLGHSQSEAAAILGQPLGTFKSLQARARAKAVRRYEEHP